jgi:hypothetical protein
MTDEPITPSDDVEDVEAHLLKEALATGAAAAAVLAGAGAATSAPMPTSTTPNVAPVLPDPGGMPAPKAPVIRLASEHSTKAKKQAKGKITHHSETTPRHQTS